MFKIQITTIFLLLFFAQKYTDKTCTCVSTLALSILSSKSLLRGGPLPHKQAKQPIFLSFFLFFSSLSLPFSQHAGNQAVLPAEVPGRDGRSSERPLPGGDETEQTTHVPPARPHQSPRQ